MTHTYKNDMLLYRRIKNDFRYVYRDILIGNRPNFRQGDKRKNPSVFKKLYNTNTLPNPI